MKLAAAALIVAAVGWAHQTFIIKAPWDWSSVAHHEPLVLVSVAVAMGIIVRDIENRFHVRLKSRPHGNVEKEYEYEDRDRSIIVGE